MITTDRAYQILGAKRTDSIQEIKRKFRVLCHVYHPDHEGGDAKKFIEIKGAYDFLVKNHVQEQIDTKVYPHWRNGFVYYWPGDSGSYVGDEDEN